MKTRFILSTVVLLSILLFGCEKNEIIAPKPDEKIDQVENSHIATNLLVRVDTGRDGLRSGNKAFISLVLVDGRVLAEQLLSSGMGSNTSATIKVTFPASVTVAQIRSIRIRHDGSPRAGHPLDSYDIWDLKYLRVRLADASFIATELLYNSDRDSRVGALVASFTGSLRQLNIPIRAIGSEPDFIIQHFYATPGGINVVIKNQGPGSGVITRVTASAPGGATVRYTSLRLDPGRTGYVTVGLPLAGTVTCAVTGVDLSGRPEAVTAFNKLSLFISR